MWQQCSTCAGVPSHIGSHRRTCPYACTAASQCVGPAVIVRSCVWDCRHRIVAKAIVLDMPRCALSRRPTFATLRATLYFCPSFSSSATTQSVMHGLHSAYRQSIMPCTRSICKKGGHQGLQAADNSALKATGAGTYFVFDGKIDEVCIHKDLVRRPQLRVVFEEQCCRGFLPAHRATQSDEFWL